MIRRCRDNRPFWEPVLAVAALILCAVVARSAEEQSPLVQPNFSWINQVAGPRPEHVWENREDAFYHDLPFPDENTATAAEFVHDSQGRTCRADWIVRRCRSSRSGRA